MNWTILCNYSVCLKTRSLEFYSNHMAAVLVELLQN